MARATASAIWFCPGRSSPPSASTAAASTSRTRVVGGASVADTEAPYPVARTPADRVPQGKRPWGPRSTDDSHRALGVRRDVLADRAENEAREAAVAARADHQQVGRRRLRYEHFGCIAFLDPRQGEDRRVLPQLLLDDLDEVIGGLASWVPYLAGRHAAAAERRQQRLLPHLDDHQVGPVVRSLGGGPRQRAATASRSVHAHHDGLPGAHDRILSSSVQVPAQRPNRY